MDESRKLITFRSMAAELGVSVGTIRNWLDEGQIRYLFLGGRRRVTRGQWEAFLKSREAEGPLTTVEDD